MRYGLVSHDLTDAVTSKHGVTCNCVIRFCLRGSRCFDWSMVMIMIVRCETGVVIMSAQLEKVMIVQMLPRGGAGACACFVCEVDVENNRVSPGYVAQ